MEIIELQSSKILNNIDFSNLVITIGQFDGIHLAHKVLIDKSIEIAKKENKKSGVMTFDPHPDYVLGKREKIGYITPLDEKISIFKNMGVDYLLIINFDIEISRLSYIEFYNIYLKDFYAIVAGFDFKFGYKGLGDSNYLKQMNKNCVIIDEIDIDDKKIASSLIRDYLIDGNVKDIKKILGQNYRIKGNVVTGDGIGRSLGFPTANIAINENYVWVKNGVYAVNVNVDDKCYLGIANIGQNPTINYQKERRLEVYIIDFNLNIYGKEIEIEFLDYIRSEVKFDSKEDLINQLKKDKKNIIKNYKGEI